MTKTSHANAVATATSGAAQAAAAAPNLDLAEVTTWISTMASAVQALIASLNGPTAQPAAGAADAAAAVESGSQTG